MRKLILSLVFVLATGSTLMNATVSNGETSPTTKEVIVVDEDFGCAGDCVRWALGTTLAIAEDIGENPNEDMMYMAIYMRYYSGCLKGCS